MTAIRKSRPNWKLVRAKKPHVCRLCNREWSIGSMVMCWTSYSPTLQGWYSVYFCPLGECGHRDRRPVRLVEIFNRPER